MPNMVGERGQTIDLADDIKIGILSPPSSRAGDDMNMSSLVLRVTHGNLSSLFMDDTGFQAVERILKFAVTSAF